jgi:hypothetical protein
MNMHLVSLRLLLDQEAFSRIYVFLFYDIFYPKP